MSEQMAEAIATAEACCERYVRWYNHGMQSEAGSVAYDTVICLRLLLAAAKTPVSEIEPLERAARVVEEYKVAMSKLDKEMLDCIAADIRGLK